jgi:hypothetical protein
MQSLVAAAQEGSDESSDRTCPIAMEEFDKVDVPEYLPPGSCFVRDTPEYCVGKLPCGHLFHPVALICHMVVNGMTCPICR